jgi:PAP2 superfamily
VTGGLLVWLYLKRPERFAIVRTTLLLASAFSLVGFLAFPTAPPRMAGTGLTDTISGGTIDLDHGLIRSLYNPYAAVPSLHAGYAVIVSASLVRYARHRMVRLAGVFYTPFVLLVIVATGNHFFFDAAAGTIVALFSALLTLCIRPPETASSVVPIGRRVPIPVPIRRAA